MIFLKNISCYFFSQVKNISVVSLIFICSSAYATDESFKFIVFGDFNSGDCYRNDRVQCTIDMMAKEYLNQIPHQAVPNIIKWKKFASSVFESTTTIGMYFGNSIIISSSNRTTSTYRKF